MINFHKLSFMKRQSIFLLSLLFFSCNKYKINDLSEFKLKGKIKTIQEISYEALENNGRIEAGKRAKPAWKKDTQRVFDKKGFLTEEIIYKTDGDIRSKSIIEHKKNEISETNYTAFEEVIYTQSARLNEVGKVIENVRYNADGEEVIKRIYLYDEKLNLIEELQYFNQSKTPSVTNKYVYDEKGNKIEEYMYNPLGVLIAKWHSDYDENGSLIEENYFFSDGSLSAQDVYSYKLDEKGNWIQQITLTNGKPRYIVLRNIEYYD